MRPERALFMTSVLAEVQSLRAAEQLNDVRVSDILKQLKAAQDDIVDCYRERRELTAKVNQLETRIADLMRREKGYGA